MNAVVNTLFAQSQHKPLMEWSDRLSVGIQEIDEQHKVLVDLINQLHDAIVHHHGAETCGQIMDKLCEYTKIHFAVEESILRILGYPEYDDHKTHHDMLLTQVKELRYKMNHEDHSISFELLHIKKKWLTIHILEEDTAYVEHLLSCGAKATFNKKSWLSRFWGN